MKDGTFVILIRDDDGAKAYIKEDVLEAIASLKTAEVSVIQDMPTFQSMKGMVGANKELQLKVIKELERNNMYRYGKMKNGKEGYIFFAPNGEE